MERRPLILGGLVAAVVLAGAGWWWSRDRAAPAAVVTRVVPEGTRIRVEVLNASEVRGLARRATFVLRDAGFDVVRFTGDDARRATNLVIDRTGHPEWARLAARALGGAGVETRPDSGRYVDLTILIGADWRPPPQPFNP
ncbi:MAG: LytR C-terminal domain-containing protein [Gemmatimonadetes bacterium]|nr:LytR C-terminal domain-containing protein [Gemmatimonadota bacterium]